jgi:hypothetical protein
MALAGAVFCISGKLSVPKSDMSATLTDAGADVVADLTKSVTHLLSTEVDVAGRTAKVHKAMRAGTPIVAESFVHACIAAGSLLDVAGPHALPKGAGSVVPKAKAKRLLKTNLNHPEPALVFHPPGNQLE